MEDDADFRTALTTTLEHKGFEVVGSFDRAKPAIAALVAARPDVALVDLSLPVVSGIEAIREMTALLPALRIVVLSARNEPADLLESLRSGAIGYLVKGAKLLDIAGAIDAAARGMSPISPEAGRHLVAEIAPPQAEKTRKPVEITKREREVLALLVQGHAYASIATALNIGQGTVQNHVKNIYRKLEVSSKAEATAVALRNGMI